MTEKRRLAAAGGRSERSRPFSPAILALAAAAACAVAAGPAWAQAASEASAQVGVNLVANPNFDGGATAWVLNGTGSTPSDGERNGWTGTAEWSAAKDADGRAESGSVELKIAADHGRCVKATQCVAVSPGRYELSGKVMMPVGAQYHDSFAGISVTWVRDASCAGSTALAETTAVTRPAPTDQPGWVTVTTGPVIVPAETRGALIYLNLCVGGEATDTESLTANFDDLVLTAVPLAGAAGVQPVAEPKADPNEGDGIPAERLKDVPTAAAKVAAPPPPGR